MKLDAVRSQLMMRGISNGARGALLAAPDAVLPPPPEPVRCLSQAAEKKAT